MTEENTTTTITEARPAHCCVAHPDAGGPCAEPFVLEVHGLPFCQEHGEEARLGAAIEAYEEAYHFFARFRNPEVPGLGSPVDRTIKATLKNLDAEGSLDRDHWHALERLAPSVPEDVRMRVNAWEADEEPGYMPVLDVLLDCLNVIHKLQRIAHEEYQTFLVEMLERERESQVAQAAVALENANRRRDEREARGEG